MLPPPADNTDRGGRFTKGFCIHLHLEKKSSGSLSGVVVFSVFPPEEVSHKEKLRIKLLIRRKKVVKTPNLTNFGFKEEVMQINFENQTW